MNRSAYALLALDCESSDHYSRFQTIQEKPVAKESRIIREIETDLDKAEESRILRANMIPAGIDTTQESDWGREEVLQRAY
jgi:hypothetical protein